MLSQHVWQKLEDLENEYQNFRQKCQENLAVSRKLQDRNQYLREELMVVMEECVAEKSKTLKVLELARSGSKSEQASFPEFINTQEETAIVLEMIEEIKKNVISSGSVNIRFLHTQLSSLSFLPESRRLRVVEPPAPLGTESTVPKPRILIVEDESIIAMDIAMQLCNLGYEPLGPARTGEQAIEMVERLRPQLVLMDINLATQMDGITVAQKIRTQFDIPCLFLSAFTGEDIQARAKLTDPAGYLAKPFTELELRTVMAAALADL